MSFKEGDTVILSPYGIDWLKTCCSRILPDWIGVSGKVIKVYDSLRLYRDDGSWLEVTPERFQYVFEETFI